MNRTITVHPCASRSSCRQTPQRAFEVFTAAIDRWWPKSHGIGEVAVKQSIIEPFEGGRWYTKCEDGTDVIVGHVRVWQPAECFVVSGKSARTGNRMRVWRSPPKSKCDSLPRLRVERECELEHRNFERMGEEAGATMRKGVDGGWPTLLELFAKEASQAPGTRRSPFNVLGELNERIGSPQHSRQSIWAIGVGRPREALHK